MEREAIQIFVNFRTNETLAPTYRYNRPHPCTSYVDLPTGIDYCLEVNPSTIHVPSFSAISF